ALKVLRAEKATEIHIERCRREAAIARGSSSPRLVRTFDLLHEDGLVLLPMELVEGGSLRDVMRRSPLPVEEVIRLAIEILQALAVLHELGILHRDLKPANLLLTSEGDVKLADFGLARRWTADDESRLTSTGAPLGTLEYISPEQALGEEVDPRTDLYSLGVILFEMLTGKLPFHATSAIGAVVRRFKERPPDVRSLRPETPRWLAAIIARLLATNREERYPSARAVLDDLTRRKARGMWRRWIRPALAAAAIAIALIAGVFWLRLREPSRLVTDGDWGVRMLDRRGHALWSRPDMRADKATFVQWRRGGQREVAAILMTATEQHDPTRVLTLSFLDPHTSRVLRTRQLPNGGASFPTYAKRWGVAQVLATDLDDDGANEVIVTYAHMFFPSFIVLHDLGRDESRVIFLASGHHGIGAVHDFDHDGTKDLLLVGVSNKLGWNTGIAAIRVPLGQSGDELVASTPDRPDTSNGQTLLWYALAPPGLLYPTGSIADGKMVLVHYRRGETYFLGLDGFAPQSRSSLAPKDRAASR
ncbi:MAG: serine/threonine-protein kinase, partial [Thermoanaerobaculia bacterium]